jgi:hypothetical protein
VIETTLVPAENAPSSSGCHSDVVLLLDLIMSFLCIIFSWAFPSYMLKFDFSLPFFSLFECRQFSLTLKMMIAYCPHKALGEGGLVQFQIPTHCFTTIPFSHLGSECPQSFTSFLVIDFHFAYFPGFLFR